MSRRTVRRAAFTLIELMVVVTIVGILAAVAIPSFKRYIYRARAAEGTAMLQEIRARQETYRLDNGRYANGPANPTTVPSGDNLGAWNQSDEDWQQMGVAPDAPAVRFQYSVVQGLPGETPPNGVLGATAQSPDFWFVSTATADLDGDGTTFFFEGYSFASHIYCSNTNGFD